VNPYTVPKYLRPQSAAPRERSSSPRPFASKRAQPLSLQSWRLRAACRDADPALFFPERNQSAKPAKRICAECPVREQCLAFAVASGERFGVFGGLAERERHGMGTRPSRPRKQDQPQEAAA
jgi:WhiB family transcriptional regulator, redox-sensing transcriptional regulator